MEALSCTRLRVLACLRDAQTQRTGELDCTLLEDLCAEMQSTQEMQEGGSA